jgi:uncharacterized protein (TIGR03066 family)
MKFTSQLLVLITILFVLGSYSSKNKATKIIGSWEVETITNSRGRIKEGKMTITFSEDGKLESTKEGVRKRVGYWEVEKRTLYLYDNSQEDEEPLTIVKLTQNKLVLKDGQKTIVCSRIK